MRNIIFLSALVLIGFASCKKKGGDNQNIDSTKKQKFDIMSTKSGSWWLYNADDGAIFYRYATSTDSNVGGLLYDYFYRIETTSVMKEKIPEYFGKFDGKYLSLIDLDGKQKNYITYVILKDNPYNGQEWINTETRKIEGWNLDMLIESKVIDINEQLIINGNTYDSVIHVYNNLKAKSVLLPGYIKCGTLEVWFKKGVGIIKDKGNIDIAPAGVSLVKKDYGDELQDYHIEP
jgi:hypothetical protein